MDKALAAWQQHLTDQTDCGPATVAEYVSDTRRFITWFSKDLPTCRPVDVTVFDAKAYRQFLLDAGRAPTTINRALISLTLFFDAAGRTSDNPFRRLERIAHVEAAPKALTRQEWNAVRRAAEQHAARDHGLARALVGVMRYAGPRVHAADPVARRAGVRPGQTLRQAQLRWPAAQLVAADPVVDATVQIGLTQLLAQHTPHVLAGDCAPHGTVSADLEHMTTRALIADLPDLAAAIRQALGLAPALGVAPAGARRCGPRTSRAHGVLIVPPRRVAAFLAPQPSAVVPVERRIAQRLTVLGLPTLGAVARVSLTALQQQIGAAAHTLHRCAHGDDPWPLPWPAPADHLRAVMHIDGGIADQRMLTTALQTLAADLAQQLQQQARSPQQITLQIGCADGDQQQETRTLATPTQQVAVLAAHFTGMCGTLPLASAVDQITVTVDQAVRCAVAQAPMFPAPVAPATARQQVVQQPDARFGSTVRVVVSLNPDAHLPKAQVAVMPWERR